jgi:hypothetical protein
VVPVDNIGGMLANSFQKPAYWDTKNQTKHVNVLAQVELCTVLIRCYFQPVNIGKVDTVLCTSSRHQKRYYLYQYLLYVLVLGSKNLIRSSKGYEAPGTSVL